MCTSIFGERFRNISIMCFVRFDKTKNNFRKICGFHRRITSYDVVLLIVSLDATFSTESATTIVSSTRCLSRWETSVSLQCIFRSKTEKIDDTGTRAQTIVNFIAEHVIFIKRHAV